MTKCAWCGTEYKESIYPNVQSFLLSYEEGTTSEDTGPNATGYELTNLCRDCAWKLFDKLKEMGIAIETTKT